VSWRSHSWRCIPVAISPTLVQASSRRWSITQVEVWHKNLGRRGRDNLRRAGGQKRDGHSHDRTGTQPRGAEAAAGGGQFYHPSFAARAIGRGTTSQRVVRIVWRSSSFSGANTTQFVLHHAAEGRLQFSSANRENLYGAKRASLDATIA
jgi:hypothetical protein